MVKSPPWRSSDQPGNSMELNSNPIRRYVIVNEDAEAAYSTDDAALAERLTSDGDGTLAVFDMTQLPELTAEDAGLDDEDDSDEDDDK